MIGRQQANRHSDRHEEGEGVTRERGGASALRDSWKTVRSQAGEQASALTRSLREHGQSVLDDQKARAAAEIQNFGAAVRRAADKLHDQNSEALAHYVDNAAESLQGVARYVEELDVTELAREAQEFARRRPAVVVGGMFLLGLGVARFIKAGQAGGSSVRRRYRGDRVK